MIDEIETRSPVELIAIGIGHDVTRYYRRAVTIVDAEELGGAMTEKLAELFDEQVADRADRRRAAETARVSLPRTGAGARQMATRWRRLAVGAAGALLLFGLHALAAPDTAAASPKRRSRSRSGPGRSRIRGARTVTPAIRPARVPRRARTDLAVQGIRRHLGDPRAARRRALPRRDRPGPLAARAASSMRATADRHRRRRDGADPRAGRQAARGAALVRHRRRSRRTAAPSMSAIERVHQIVRFDYGRNGLLARGQPIAVPPELQAAALQRQHRSPGIRAERGCRSPAR